MPKKFKFKARGVGASGTKFSAEGTVNAADAMEAAELTNKLVTQMFDGATVNKIDVREVNS